MRFFTFVGMLALLLASGCILNPLSPLLAGSHEVDQPVSTHLGGFRNARVEVKSTLAEPVEKQSELMTLLENRLIGQLREQGTFAAVQATNSPADLRIVVTLTHIRTVSKLNWSLQRALAGPATADAKVEFRERATDKLIGSGHAHGQSSGSADFRPLPQEAVYELANQIAKLAQENRMLEGK